MKKMLRNNERTIETIDRDACDAVVSLESIVYDVQRGRMPAVQAERHVRAVADELKRLAKERKEMSR